MDAGTFYGIKNREKLFVRIIANNGFCSENSELEGSDSDEEWTPERDLKSRKKNMFKNKRHV